MKKELINDVFQDQKNGYLEFGMRSAKDRVHDLKNLRHSLLKHRTEILEALHIDLGKPPVEAELSDIFPVKKEIDQVIRNLPMWQHPRRVRAPLSLIGTTGYIRPESKGVVLIISPWNFPFNLTLGPVISAIAAGNCVVLKPSEYTPASNAVLRKIIESVFSKKHICMIEGGRETSEYLTQLPFDHIFFTGSPTIGKKVMAAAATNLCSVTLELGGKNPTIIDRDVDLEDALKRVVWGKFFNCGQVCISPDYLIVPEERLEEICQKLEDRIRAWYGEFPLDSDELGCIINEQHWERLNSLIEDCRSRGAKIRLGGRGSKEVRKFEPTIISHVDSSMEIMNEEIFGPILPIITYSDISEVNHLVSRLPRPLAYYVFSKNKKNIEQLVKGSRAGTTGINETYIQFVFPGLPFGGTNHSGMGKSHGQAGFEVFSNYRSFVLQRSRYNMVRLIFPPYGKLEKWIARFSTRWL